MRWLSSCAALALYAGSIHAGSPPDPLRALPGRMDWVVQVNNPRQIVDTVYSLDAFKELQKLPVIREAYETTNARRFFQLVAYFEKQLGHAYPELINHLAGGGMALGVQFSGKAPQVVAVVQAKDKALLAKFVKLGLEIVSQELARQDSKAKPVAAKHRQIEITRLAPQVHFAVADATLIFATDGKAMKDALDVLLDGQKSMAHDSGLAKARKQLAPGALAWTWLNLASVRGLPDAKAGFEMARLDPNVLFIFGGLMDAAYRSPYVVAGLYHDKNEFKLSARAATGRDGMKGAAMLVPDTGAGSLPLLEPANVLASGSWHLDLGKFWQDRAAIFTPEQLKALEAVDKDSGRFLGGVKLGQLLSQAGPHQRVVVTQQTKIGYKTAPKAKYPAFALVQSMRDTEFARNMETALRGAALLGSFQANLKLVEEKRGQYTLVGYRFPEDKDVFVGGDYQTAQFNFSPCFAAVKNQFIVSSTIELGRELIDLVDKEDLSKTSTATTRQRLYSSGGADILRGNQEFLLTQLILSQALPPRAARQQLNQLIELVDGLGMLNMEIHYGPNEARMDVRVTLGQKR